MRKICCWLLLGLLLFPAWMGISRDGYVMVEFSGSQPDLVTDMPVTGLPRTDAELLFRGHCLPDGDSYTKAMEDFCS